MISLSASLRPTLGLCVRTDHSTGNYIPHSFRSVCRFFYVPFQFYVWRWRRQGQRHCPMTRSSELKHILSTQPACFHHLFLGFEPAIASSAARAFTCGFQWMHYVFFHTKMFIKANVINPLITDNIVLTALASAAVSWHWNRFASSYTSASAVRWQKSFQGLLAGFDRLLQAQRVSYMYRSSYTVILFKFTQVFKVWR